MLEVQNLQKRFGALAVTKGVSLTVEKGTISALVGPNGAGKTTLFNMVSGFLRPDSGDIRYCGNSIVGLEPEKICALGLTRTFQIVQPFAGQTVRENIAVGAYLHHPKRREALEYAQMIGTKVGLASHLDKLAMTLTTSARKRLELAKALATKPQLLLLDEVMAGLNPTEIDEIIPVIRGIRASGVTVLLIEHVMRAVVNLSDHVWVLNNGSLVSNGTPKDIAADPMVIEAYLGQGAAQRMNAIGAV